MAKKISRNCINSKPSTTSTAKSTYLGSLASTISKEQITQTQCFKFWMRLNLSENSFSCMLNFKILYSINLPFWSRNYGTGSSLRVQSVPVNLCRLLLKGRPSCIKSGKEVIQLTSSFGSLTIFRKVWRRKRFTSTFSSYSKVLLRLRISRASRTHRSMKVYRLRCSRSISW